MPLGHNPGTLALVDLRKIDEAFAHFAEFRGLARTTPENVTLALFYDDVDPPRPRTPDRACAFASSRAPGKRAPAFSLVTYD